jgi:hypothetical protein
MNFTRLVNSVGPVYFGSVDQFNVESCPVVRESIGVVVLILEDVAWYPFYRALSKHRPRGCYRVKMWRRRLYAVIDVRTIDQSGESITFKVHGPSGDVMERANLMES